MIGLLLMFIGFPALIVGVVFLFFNKFLTKGFIIILISIFFILFGFKECSKFHLYPTNEELRLEELEYEKQDKISAKKLAKTPPEKANKQIQIEIEKNKEELVGDSIDFYLKYSNDLKSIINQFEQKIERDMNSDSRINHPFQNFDFEKLSRLKKQKKWKSFVKFIVPVQDELFHVSGFLANDSNCIVYDGYLNFSEHIIYWTSFQPKTIIIKNCNSFDDFESDDIKTILRLNQASKKIKEEFIYWRVQRSLNFITKQVLNRKDQKNNCVLFEGKFIPFYKINQVKGHGEIILRNFYKF